MCVLLEARQATTHVQNHRHDQPALPFRAHLIGNQSPPRPTRSEAAKLYNSLELPRVAQRVLNDQLAHLLLAARAGSGLVILVAACLGGGRLCLLGEVDPAVLEGPAAGAGKVDDGALGFEEEKGLCGRDGQGRVGALAAGGDLGADLGREDLFCWRW